jgi:hypothetical protein
VAALSLVLAGLVVGITVCVAIGYIVFLQPNPDSNVPDLPPSDAVVETPDELGAALLPTIGQLQKRAREHLALQHQGR